jgi:hypothetical protein
METSLNRHPALSCHNMGKGRPFRLAVLALLSVAVFKQLPYYSLLDAPGCSVSKGKTTPGDIGIVDITEYVRRDEITREDFMERFALTEGYSDDEEEALEVMHKVHRDGNPVPIKGHPFLFVGSGGKEHQHCTVLYLLELFEILILIFLFG